MASGRRPPRARGDQRQGPKPQRHTATAVLRSVSPVPAATQAVRAAVARLETDARVPPEVALAVQVLLDATDAAESLALGSRDSDQPDLVDRLARAWSVLHGLTDDDGALKYFAYRTLVLFSREGGVAEQGDRCERIGRVVQACIGRRRGQLQAPSADAVRDVLTAIGALPDPWLPNEATARAFNSVLKPMGLAGNEDGRSLGIMLRRYRQRDEENNP